MGNRTLAQRKEVLIDLLDSRLKEEFLVRVK